MVIDNMHVIYHCRNQNNILRSTLAFFLQSLQFKIFL